MQQRLLTVIIPQTPINMFLKLIPTQERKKPKRLTIFVRILVLPPRGHGAPLLHIDHHAHDTKLTQVLRTQPSERKSAHENPTLVELSTPVPVEMGANPEKSAQHPPRGGPKTPMTTTGCVWAMRKRKFSPVPLPLRASKCSSSRTQPSPASTSPPLGVLARIESFCSDPRPGCSTNGEGRDAAGPRGAGPPCPFPRSCTGGARRSSPGMDQVSHPGRGNGLEGTGDGRSLERALDRYGEGMEADAPVAGLKGRSRHPGQKGLEDSALGQISTA